MGIPRRRKLALVLLLCAVGWLACSPVASAATPEEDAAKPVYDEGRQLFAKGRYEQALEKFLTVWRVLKNDYLRFYLGRTFAALDRCSEAIPFLEAVRQAFPQYPDKEAKRRADEVKCRLGRAARSLRSFRCKRAVTDLQAIGSGPIEAKLRRQRDALLPRATRCERDFGTGDEAGRQAARRHSEAREYLKLKDFARAEEAARLSLAAKASTPARWVRGVALAELNTCGKALPVLDGLAGKVTGADEGRRERLAIHCRLAEARREVEAGDCRAALVKLKALAGRLSQRDEAWRAEKEAWCAPRATEFLTDTTERKSAYGLFKAARKAKAEGKLERAADLYGKALAFADEPLIRRELALTRVRLGRCDEARKVLAAGKPAAMTEEDGYIQRACDELAPTVRLTGDELMQYVGSLTDALRQLAAGDHEQALPALGLLSKKGKNRRVEALRIDALFEADRCGRYLARLEAAPELRELLTDPATRAQACRQKATASDTTTPDDRAGLGKDTADSLAPREISAGTEMSDTETAGWVLVGVGAAATVVAVVFAALYPEDRAAQHDAVSRYNKLAAWPAEEADLVAVHNEADEARIRANTDSEVAWSMAGVAVATLVIGLYLVLDSSEDAPPDTKESGEVDSVDLNPVFAPTGVGLVGRF